MMDLARRFEEAGYEVKLGTKADWEESNDIIVSKNGEEITVHYIPQYAGGAYDVYMGGEKLFFTEFEDIFEHVTGEKFYEN